MLKIIMDTGEKLTINDVDHSIEKKIRNIVGITREVKIDSDHIASVEFVKEKFVHTMMPDITGVKVEW